MLLHTVAVYCNADEKGSNILCEEQVLTLVH